jgi:cold shock protein
MRVSVVIRPECHGILLRTDADQVLQFPKGFGFIRPQDGGKNVFVHVSTVERAGMSNLDEGQRGGYDVLSERVKIEGRESTSRLALGCD